MQRILKAAPTTDHTPKNETMDLKLDELVSVQQINIQESIFQSQKRVGKYQDLKYQHPASISNSITQSLITISPSRCTRLPNVPFFTLAVYDQNNEKIHYSRQYKLTLGTNQTEFKRMAYGCEFSFTVTMREKDEPITECSLTQLVVLGFEAMQNGTLATLGLNLDMCGDVQVYDNIKNLTEQMGIMTHLNSKTAIVTFLGTQLNFWDWWQNFKVTTKTCEHTEAHTGFCEEYLKVYQQMRKILDNLHQKGYQIVFGGHSQGGAVAVIAAANFKKMGFNVQGLVTWGAPRASGTGGLAQFVEQNIPYRLRYIMRYQPYWSILEPSVDK
eukprot:Awhi_evm2s2960